MQIFYHALSNSTRETMDAVVGGAFLSLTLAQATALVKRWPLIKVGVKNIRRPTREVEVCTSSRK
jgi:hypothetical protein